MPTQCLQSLNSGEQCNAPAVNGSKFCRHHDPQRPRKETQTDLSETEPLVLPPLLDKPSALVALNEVAQALAEGRIKRSVAQTLLSAIKLADRLITEIAESGAAFFPTGIAAGSHSVVSQTARAACNDDRNGAVALAASGDRPRAADSFNPARRYSNDGSPAHSSDIDPSTARIVRELIAQSHKPEWSQKVRA